MVKWWSDGGQTPTHTGGPGGSRACERSNGRTVCQMNDGQTMVEWWSHGGQIAVKRWSNGGQKPTQTGLPTVKWRSGSHPHSMGLQTAVKSCGETREGCRKWRSNGMVKNRTDLNRNGPCPAQKAGAAIPDGVGGSDSDVVPPAGPQRPDRQPTRLAAPLGHRLRTVLGSGFRV